MKTLHVQYIVHAIYCSKTGYRISELLSDWRTAVLSTANKLSSANTLLGSGF